jgi:hypothetical protein
MTDEPHGEIMDPEVKRRADAIKAIVGEREYQRLRWTIEEDKSKPPEYWLGVLTIYLGKAGQETPVYQGSNYSKERFRKRVTQIGAICATILEATDPNGTGEGETDEG